MELAPGTVVSLVDEKGKFVARGWADEGPIAVRVVTVRDEPVDAQLLSRRLEAAAAMRDRVLPPRTNCYRLVHGEGDRLPGIVCDVYGAFATLALDGAAARAWRDTLIEVFVPVLQRRGVRGLMVRTGRRGQRKVALRWGEHPPAEVQVQEHGMTLGVDLVAGQKTGLFLDHRESRRRVRQLSSGLRVLDLYSYVGGFSVAAGTGGATHVTTVDVAPGAIEQARRNWALNGLEEDVHARICADVPETLAALKRDGHRFDLIIADPPSFAPNHAAKPAALKAYRLLHKSSLEILAPGGWYLAASCSSHIDLRDFEDMLIEGADEARRTLQVLDRWGAPPDHPRLLVFPEGDYLKVVLTKATD